MDLPASVGSTADYVRLLGTLWSFYGPLEAQLGSIDGLAGALPDWSERRKAHLLAADLAALGAGVPAGNDATSAALAAVGDLPAAFGALYVSEGSTLGGAIVGPNIRSTLRARGELGEAFTFYGAYGPLLGSRWRDFIAALSHEADASPAAPARIVASACLTFETFIANLSRECEAEQLGRSPKQ
jgi:heme oxygenase